MLSVHAGVSLSLPLLLMPGASSGCLSILFLPWSLFFCLGFVSSFSSVSKNLPLCHVLSSLKYSIECEGKLNSPSGIQYQIEAVTSGYPWEWKDTWLRQQLVTTTAWRTSSALFVTRQWLNGAWSPDGTSVTTYDPKLTLTAGPKWIATLAVTHTSLSKASKLSFAWGETGNV